MAKRQPKRPINEQDKINFSKGKKFSKENQPSPEAKSAGKKKRRTMCEMLDYLLEKEITNKQGEKATTLEAISVALIKQAMSGNVKAFEVLRDTIGQNPMHKVVAFEAPEETKEAFLKHLKEL